MKVKMFLLTLALCFAGTALSFAQSPQMGTWKLDEAKSKRDMLIARHRRSVALNKAAQAHNAAGDGAKSAAFDRLKDRVNQSESVASAELELNSDEVGERLNRLDRDTEVERLLTDLKQRRLLPG